LEEAQAGEEEGADGEARCLDGGWRRTHQAIDAIEAEPLTLVVWQQDDPGSATAAVADFLVIVVILTDIWTKPQQELSSCEQDGQRRERPESIKKFRVENDMQRDSKLCPRPRFYSRQCIRRSMRRGFVTFEGIDGSGKTSVAEEVTRRLEKKRIGVVLTTEPTKTWLGDAVKRSYDEDVSPFTEALLFMADRATHTEQIKKWVKQGKLVVSDRYSDSTYAYQAARLRGIVKDPLTWLKRMSVPFVIQPDLTLLLDVEPRLGLKRISPRAKKVHFEVEPFLRQVRRNYLELAKSRRFVVIDASRSFEDVVNESLQCIITRVRARGVPRK